MLNQLLLVKNVATKAFYGAKLFLGHYGPAISVGAGIIGVVVGTVVASKATLTVKEVIDQDANDLALVKQTYEEKPNIYTLDNYRHDLVSIYTARAVRVIKHYGPAIIIEALSIGAIVGGHATLWNRNIAMAGAYKLVAEGFKKYRQRVSEKYGAEIDRDIRMGVVRQEETEIVVDEEGKKKKVKTVVSSLSSAPSDYMRYFDGSNPQWRKSRTQNEYFLTGQQNYANDALHNRGHIFLNEVYDSLGMPRTKEGAIVGWIDDGSGEMNVKFDVFVDDADDGEELYAIDFNVQGVIYDLI